MLYVPSGFLGRSRPKGEDPLADRRGKILRVTRDGASPGDNPHGARAPRVWASGFKNAFDLAFFPGTNPPSPARAGLRPHDEINLVMPGDDYGYLEPPGCHDSKRRDITVARRTAPTARRPPGSFTTRGTGTRPSVAALLMCEYHGRGTLALRINRVTPGRLRNLTPLVPECTIDLVQTRDGTVVFSDSSAIYRLVQR